MRMDSMHMESGQHSEELARFYKQVQDWAKSTSGVRSSKHTAAKETVLQKSQINSNCRTLNFDRSAGRESGLWFIEGQVKESINGKLVEQMLNSAVREEERAQMMGSYGTGKNASIEGSMRNAPHEGPGIPIQCFGGCSTCSEPSPTYKLPPGSRSIHDLPTHHRSGCTVCNDLRFADKMGRMTTEIDGNFTIPPPPMPQPPPKYPRVDIPYARMPPKLLVVTPPAPAPALEEKQGEVEGTEGEALIPEPPAKKPGKAGHKGPRKNGKLTAREGRRGSVRPGPAAAAI